MNKKRNSLVHVCTKAGEIQYKKTEQQKSKPNGVCFAKNTHSEP